MTSEVDPSDLKREESASPSFTAHTGVTTPSPTGEQHNDLLDDVFGSSEPSSPVDLVQGVPVASGEFASSTPVNATVMSTNIRTQHTLEHRETPDISRLRTIHSTNGYRDGLAVARESAIQPGFDEGYSLGAAMGLKAGLVVGSFESLTRAVSGLSNAKLKGQLDALSERCRGDLSRAKLFGTEYIDEEGTWKWAAPADGSFHDIAAAHPVIKIWLLKLDSVLHRLGIGPDKLEIRWTENVPSSTPDTPKASRLPQARGGEGQSGQTFEF